MAIPHDIQARAGRRAPGARRRSGLLLSSDRYGSLRLLRCSPPKGFSLGGKPHFAQVAARGQRRKIAEADQRPEHQLVDEGNAASRPAIAFEDDLLCLPVEVEEPAREEEVDQQQEAGPMQKG